MMPITAAQVQSLKRTNISKDAEKTAQRAKEIWKGLKLVQRDAIKELAGVSSQSVYKVYNDGGISIKLAIAFAQTLGISPYYLTGEADEPGECTDSLIRELLLQCGYQKFVAELELPEEKPAKRKYTRHIKPEADETLTEELPAEDAAAEEPPAEVPAPQPTLTTQLPPGSEALTAEDLQDLVFALYVQAKASIPGSKEKLDQIKQVIFS
ncbi:MAG: hypothetical protein FWC27_03820 [Firmicutes bacterium]|nr:hypothetical protein [Bacillota bacterium]